MSWLLNIVFCILPQPNDGEISIRINKPYADSAILLLFLCMLLCFSLGLQLHQQSCKGKRCCLRLAHCSCLFQSLWWHLFCLQCSLWPCEHLSIISVKSGGLTWPMRCLTLLKQWSHIFSSAYSPAVIKHVLDRNNDIWSHCCPLLHEGMSKPWGWLSQIFRIHWSESKPFEWCLKNEDLKIINVLILPY